MFSKPTLQQWHLFIGVYALLLWSACEVDPPGPTCDDDVPTLVFSDGYCDQAFIRFFNLADPQPGDIPSLADYCTTDYSVSRVFRLPAPSQTLTEALSIYTNFPGTVTVEIIGSNCQQNLPFLIDCYTVEGIADHINLDLSGSTAVEDLLVRVVAEPNFTGYQPGDFTRDEITVAAFSSQESPNEFDNGLPISCDGNAIQRVILSTPSGNLEEIIDVIGLPVSQTCGCSNGELVALEVPYGVDLLTLKPKLKDRTTQALTDTFDLAFDIDYLINRPNQDQTSIDANDDIAFGNAADCVEFQPAFVGSSTNPEDGVVVAFVDSGIDINNWGSEFSQNNYQGATPDCWAAQGLSFSEYGYDMIFNDPIPNDISGHGTDVAGTFISQYSSQVPLSLLHFKFFSATRGSYYDALCGSYLAAASGADILNWSWGFPETELPGSLANLLSYLREQNIIVVAAAGNEMMNIDFDPVYPAAAASSFDNLIAVASYSYLNSPKELIPELLDFSNFGSGEVAIAAYGISEAPLVGTSELHSPVGTSISVPLVAKQLARFKAVDLNASYLNIIEAVFDQVLIEPALAGDIGNGRYLQLGCVDDDQPEP